MLLYRVVLFFLIMSVIAGYTESQSRLRALDPAACSQYQCRTVHAYWTGTAGVLWAVHVTNKDDNADDGTPNIFTTNSVEKLPTKAGTVMVDHWKYTTCIPFCGKDGAGKWQATQEVLRVGAKMPGTTATPIARAPCLATEGGKEGPKVNPEVNANTKGYTPPGYTPDPKPE